jgi:uncharacterized protein (TIGR02147 family)
MQKPKIYNFTDYRDYLREAISFFKGKKVSMRSIAKQIGVSNAYISMVLSMKRNLDLKYIEEFSDFLGLNISERSYFESLVIISDDESSRKRSEAYKKLSKFRSYKNNQLNDVVTHKYLNNWYYVTIRELSFHDGFKEDPEWIQSVLRPSLTITKIKKALEFLNKHNLLFSSKDAQLDCSNGVYKLSLTHFHQDMLKVMSESIEEVDRSKRTILGFTKTLSQRDFSKANEILNEALSKLEQLETTSDSSEQELFHFYLMGVPLTKKDKE